MVEIREAAEANGITERKEIRYEIYAGLKRLVHGKLGAGNRKQIPYCIIAEISDIYHAPDGRYIGHVDSGEPLLAQPKKKKVATTTRR